MTVNKFKIGDRVIAKRNSPEGNDSIRANDCGTVCQILTGGWTGATIGVEWDHRLKGGHSCGGNCNIGFGWRVRVDDIDLFAAEEEADFEIEEDAFMEILKNV